MLFDGNIFLVDSRLNKFMGTTKKIVFFKFVSRHLFAFVNYYQVHT